jgi:Ca-activated chloride channel family protein
MTYLRGMLGSADAQEARADGGTMKRLSHMLLGFTMLIASACSQSRATAPVTAMINATPPPPILAGDASLVGFCKAKDGSVLPGVTVAIRDGAGHQQTAVTDVQGSFAFRMILPGQYTIRWELAGYGTATRVVTVAAGKTADVTGTLNPSVMESITVTAEAPLQGVRRSGSTTISLNDARSGTPTSRDPWTIIQRAPGTVPENNTAFYAPIAENGFKATKDNATTTFSIDVDKASYANVRRFLMANVIPPPDAVRVEEMINYFAYHYPQPSDGRPFAVSTEVAGCPWNTAHRLLRIGIQGKTTEQWQLAPNNLVFLLDVSGSMEPPDRLPLIKSALHLLVEQLRADDTVAIVVYAGAAGVVLPPTSGADKQVILAALDNLEAGGSTNGAEGIELAYKLAREKFLTKGNNRVILATDGDFNVGVSSFEDLTRLIERQRSHHIYLTCLGVGDDNLQDGTIEMLADKGNGNYFYLDSINEAKKVFQRELSGTLVTVADDVKVQLTFDPSAVKSYRQIGYEKRALDNNDFTDDTKDAGELGSGHSVTALYEIEPLRTSGTIATLKLRYKEPGAMFSREVTTTTITDEGKSVYDASPDTQFAAAIAEFAMLLRNSKHLGTATWADVAALARAMRGEDIDGYREELLRMIDSGRSLLGDHQVATK